MSNSAQCLPDSVTLPLSTGTTFHEINEIVTSACCVFALIVSTLLMGMHAGLMTRPREQLHILKVIAVVPVNAIGIAVAVFDLNAWAYIDPWLKAYEGFAIGYFYLLLTTLLVRPDASRPPRGPDVFLAFLRADATIHQRRSPTQKLRGYWLRWALVFQCPAVLLGVAVASNVTQATNAYCLGSNDGKFAYIYLKAFQTVSIVVAAVSVVRTYFHLKTQLVHHRTLQKLFAFKVLVGLQVVQEVAYKVLHAIHPSPLDPTPYLSARDIEIGLPLMIVSIELVFLSVFFHFAYTVTPYQAELGLLEQGGHHPHPPPVRADGEPIRRWRLLLACLDLSDLGAAMWFTLRVGTEARKERPKMDDGLLLLNRDTLPEAAEATAASTSVTRDAAR
ncbi:organic solute transporter Ostalpha-domain-containing protein [Xylariaceae sp. FL0804]|nr:organic solute transporter Ostalpha-domain-containing protein [Xylariaceae sp. FL0804]